MSFTAKTVVIDVLNNWGNASYVGLRRVEFKSGGSVIPVAISDFAGYHSSQFSSTYSSAYAWITAGDKTGSWNNQSWLSSTNAAQRIIAVFYSEIEFDAIVVNNAHHNGGYTTAGAKDIEIRITSSTYTDTTPGAAVTGGSLIFDGQLTEHPATDTSDDQTLSLSDGADDLTGAGVTAGAPSIGTPTAAEISTDDLTAAGVVAGAPVIGGATMGQVHGITAAGVTAGAVSIGRPAVDWVQPETPASRTWRIPGESRTWKIPFENRTWRIS